MQDVSQRNKMTFVLKLEIWLHCLLQLQILAITKNCAQMIQKYLLRYEGTLLYTIGSKWLSVGDGNYSLNMF